MLKITTYKELYDFVHAFKQKRLTFLILISDPGLGKSYVVQEATIEEGPLWISGMISPLKLYLELLERNNEDPNFLVVFDDVITLFQEKRNIALLLQLCDSRGERVVRYASTTPILRGIEKEFVTKAKVIMLYNELKPENPILKALYSRAHLLNFAPSNTEILNNLRTWATDKEILDFIKAFVPFSKSLSLRAYKRAKELKDSGLNWKRELINELEVNPKLFEVHKLLNKPLTEEERANLFGSRSDWFRWRRVYLAKNSVPKFQ